MSPSELVFGMGYLSNSGFNYHLRWSSLKLNPSCFDDDLMLCKGDITSIKILCQSVELFSASSGLFANNLLSTWTK